MAFIENDVYFKHFPFELKDNSSGDDFTITHFRIEYRPATSLTDGVFKEFDDGVFLNDLVTDSESDSAFFLGLQKTAILEMELNINKLDIDLFNSIRLNTDGFNFATWKFSVHGTTSGGDFSKVLGVYTNSDINSNKKYIISNKESNKSALLKLKLIDVYRVVASEKLKDDDSTTWFDLFRAISTKIEKPIYDILVSSGGDTIRKHGLHASGSVATQEVLLLSEFINTIHGNRLHQLNDKYFRQDVVITDNAFNLDHWKFYEQNSIGGVGDLIDNSTLYIFLSKMNHDGLDFIDICQNYQTFYDLLGGLAINLLKGVTINYNETAGILDGIVFNPIDIDTVGVGTDNFGKKENDIEVEIDICKVGSIVGHYLSGQVSFDLDQSAIYLDNSIANENSYETELLLNNNINGFDKIVEKTSNIKIWDNLTNVPNASGLFYLKNDIALAVHKYCEYEINGVNFASENTFENYADYFGHHSSDGKDNINKQFTLSQKNNGIANVWQKTVKHFFTTPETFTTELTTKMDKNNLFLDFGEASVLDIPQLPTGVMPVGSVVIGKGYDIKTKRIKYKILTRGL